VLVRIEILFFGQQKAKATLLGWSRGKSYGIHSASSIWFAGIPCITLG
jgi:hypothetical protein